MTLMIPQSSSHASLRCRLGADFKALADGRGLLVVGINQTSSKTMNII